MFFEFIVESGMNFANILKVGSYTQISNYCPLLQFLLRDFVSPGLVALWPNFCVLL